MFLETTQLMSSMLVNLCAKDVGDGKTLHL